MNTVLAKAQSLLNQQKPDPDKAIKVLKSALKGQSNNWLAHHYFGVAQLQKKEYNKAIVSLKKSLKNGSNEPETYHLLSIAYYSVGDFSNAEEFEKRALEIKDDFLKGWMHLGATYRAQAKLDDALKSYQKANSIDPANAGVAFRIAVIYYDQGVFSKAEELFKITLRVDADYYEAALGLSKIYEQKKDYDHAVHYINYVLEKDPKHYMARIALAESMKAQGNYDKAIDIYEEMLNDLPGDSAVRVNYALCLLETGRFNEAEKNYLIALKKDPEIKESLSNYLMGIHYNPENSKEEIFEAHKLWDQHYAPKKRPRRAIPSNIDPDKKLKVGFLSGGLRKHPVGWMITQAIENLPKDQVEVFCYTTNNIFDAISNRIKNSSKVWKSVVGYNDEVIAGLISEDEIDILVELSGHSADNRLETVALEPAPISVKWVGGLFNTSGLKSMDYLLSDHFETPVGEEDFYTEKLVRMPDDYICFLPPEYSADIDPLPAKDNGFITFGCFNNPSKLNPVLLEKWAKILNKVPNSRLFLKSRQYDTVSFCRNIIDQMQKHGIPEDRLTFEGYAVHEDLLKTYNNVDIALDPWPYSGGLTTCEALWMGVPVITKPGPTFAGRHSATHLHNAGFSEWVTDSWDKYINTAVELASDISSLESIRKGLRQKVAESPLCDGERFGKNLSVAFREMWKQRVAGYEQKLPEGKWQDHIDVKAILNEETETGNSASLTEERIHINGTKNNKRKSSALDQNVEIETRTGAETSDLAVNENGKTQKANDEPLKILTIDDVIICTPDNTKLLTPYVLLEQEEWYENELAFIREYLKPGMKIADIGAAFGVYTLPMAKKLGGSGKVFSFEPNIISRRYLEISKVENNLQNLEVIGKAVSDKAGKAHLSISETPEVSYLSEEGEEVSVIKLDDWWKFEGKPDLDLIKIDVNNHELQVLDGAQELFEKSSPVLIISIAENPDLTKFSSFLEKYSYKLYEYIPGPGLLTEHDLSAGADAYMQNLIAVKEDQLKELEEEGWFHDEAYTPEEPETGLWTKVLCEQPWTSNSMNEWEVKAEKGDMEDYIRALDYICAAEKVDLSDTANKYRRSEKAVLLLGAAQLLIQIYNSGDASTSVALSLIRCLNALGQRGQAVEVLQKLLESTKLGQENINTELPFLLPISDQDNTSIKTDYSKWLMVRLVESWILLKDMSTYFSGEQEKKLLEGLEGNMEVLNTFRRINNIHTNREKVSSRITEISKINILIPGFRGGAHGIHEKRAKELANGFKEYGINTELISANSPDFLRKVIEAGTNVSEVFYAGVMGYDFWLETDMNPGQNVFDLAGNKVFAVLADHPYTSFMWRRMERFPKNGVLLASSPSLAFEVSKIYGINEVVVSEKRSPTVTFYNRAVKPLSERNIDILIPWGLHKFFGNQNTLRQQLQPLGKNAVRMGERVHKLSMEDYETSVFQHFLHTSNTILGSEYKFNKPLNNDDRLWLQVLSIVDWNVRKDRRLRMLKTLVNVPENKQVVITAHPQIAHLVPELDKKKNISWIGEVKNEKLEELYSDSKIVFSCNPTFPDSIHERITNAMVLGCCVVSDFSPGLSSSFKSGSEILFTDNHGTELTEFVNLSLDELQKIASNGQSIIETQYSKEGYLNWLIEVIQHNVNPK